jgi:hypothetical protein
MRKKQSLHSYPAAAVLVLAAALLLCAPAGAQSAWQCIDSVKIAPENFPAGWVLEKELVAEPAGLERFEAIYRTEVEAVVNQVFDFNGKKVQINYCLFSPALAEAGALKIAAYVNYTNAVVQNKNVVVEVISEDPWLKLAALCLVMPEKVYRAAIKQKDIPADWRFSELVVAQQANLGRFEAALGARLAGVINQFFSVGQQAVQVNLVEAIDAENAKAAFEKMKALSAGRNQVLLKDTLVAEIICNDEALALQAAKLVLR